MAKSMKAAIGIIPTQPARAKPPPFRPMSLSSTVPSFVCYDRCVVVVFVVVAFTTKAHPQDAARGHNNMSPRKIQNKITE